VATRDERWARDFDERVKTGSEDLDVALWIATVPHRYVDWAVVPLDAFSPNERLRTQCRCCGPTAVLIGEIERALDAAKSAPRSLRKPLRITSSPLR
jgi:hypothetical protein